jgi:hypothetical protein
MMVDVVKTHEVLGMTSVLFMVGGAGEVIGWTWVVVVGRGDGERLAGGCLILDLMMKKTRPAINNMTGKNKYLRNVFLGGFGVGGCKLSVESVGINGAVGLIWFGSVKVTSVIFGYLLMR